MTNNDKNEVKKKIETSGRDVAVSFGKAIANMVPLGGTFLAEYLGLRIPNQRMDRIADVLNRVWKRVDKIEEKLIANEGTDLFEDAMSQAARAVTEERKEHIANLLKNGLTRNDLDHIQKKKLFSILDNLNDAEIVLLKIFTLTKNERFPAPDIIRKHPYLVRRSDIKTTPEEDRTKEIFLPVYEMNLERNGLIGGEIEPESGSRLTALGKSFLKYLDLK